MYKSLARDKRLIAIPADLLARLTEVSNKQGKTFQAVLSQVFTSGLGVLETGPDEIKILKTLVVDKGEIIKNLSALVEQAKEVFLIEDPGGRIVFQNFGELSDEKRVLALLTGKYFAYRLGLIPDFSLGISEIAQELGRPKTSLSGDLGQLVTEGLVVKLPIRKYQITYTRIKDIIPLIVRKQKKGEPHGKS